MRAICTRAAGTRIGPRSTPTGLSSSFSTNSPAKKIYRAEEIPIYSLDPRFVADVAGLIERRASLAVTRGDGELFVDVAGQSLRSVVTEHRVGT